MFYTIAATGQRLHKANFDLYKSKYVQIKNNEGLCYKIMQFITVYISMYKNNNIHVELSIAEIQDVMIAKV